jgi:hypothetical protein
MKVLSASILACLLVALCGCATYKARAYSEKAVASYPRIYVVNNLDDNHHVDKFIVAALMAEGIQAESGPETMQPEGTEVLLSYRDGWNWDFSDHLVELHIQVRDAKYNYLMATANFDGPVSMKTNPETVCRRLIREILKAPLPRRIRQDAGAKKP